MGSQLFLFESVRGHNLIIKAQFNYEARQKLEQFLLENVQLPPIDNWKFSICLGRLSGDIFSLPINSFSL